MAFPIQPAVVRKFSFVAFGPLMRRNDRFHLLLDHPVVEILGGIAPVGNQAVKSEAVHQLNCLTDGRCLSSGQSQTQGIAQPVDRDMNLGCEPAATTSQGLHRLSAAFFGHRRHTDEPEQSCCQSCPVPYPDHRQSGSASFLTRPARTTGQTVCRPCSICLTRPARAAMGHCCGSTRGHLPQTGDILFHPGRCKRSGRLSKNLVSLSIGYPAVSQLS